MYPILDISRRWGAGYPDDVFEVVVAFIQEHRACGELWGDANPLTPDGYYFWLACSRGARLDRWVTEEMAVQDLVWSPLAALPN